MKKISEKAVLIAYFVLSILDFHRLPSFLYWILHDTDLLGDSPATAATPAETLDMLIGMWYVSLIGVMLAITFFVALRYGRVAPFLTVSCIDHAVYLVFAHYYITVFGFYHLSEISDLARLGHLTLRTVFLVYLIFRFARKPRIEATPRPLPPTALALLYMVVALFNCARISYTDLLFTPISPNFPLNAVYHFAILAMLAVLAVFACRNKSVPFCVAATVDLTATLIVVAVITPSFDLLPQPLFLLPVCLILHAAALVYTVAKLHPSAPQRKDTL